MEKSDRTEKLLALLLLSQLKNARQGDKVIQLNLAGFTNVEIADLLEIKAANVSQLLYDSKKARQRSSEKTRQRQAKHS